MILTSAYCPIHKLLDFSDQRDTQQRQAEADQLAHSQAYFDRLQGWRYEDGIDFTL